MTTRGRRGGECRGTVNGVVMLGTRIGPPGRRLGRLARLAGPSFRCAGLIALALGAIHDGAGAQQATFVAAGDVEWSHYTSPPGIYWDPEEAREGEWHRIPYVNDARSRAYLEARGRVLETPESHHLAARRLHPGITDPTELARYPFQKIADVLREADVAFLNLENPLSDDARRSGAFRAPTTFAAGLQWAGVDVVSTANNHALDAEGQGLLDTRAALERAGVAAVGTGRDLDEARRPWVTEVRGVRIAVLAYANYGNSGPSAFALSDRSGMAPLDPLLIAEDISRVRDRVDHVILSFHWGIENVRPLHPAAPEFARRMIDAGADVILGHGPHLPRGIEAYRGKVIVYSMGNFIFGHNHDYWDDNIIVRLTLEPERIARVEVLPVAGRGAALAQPYALDGPDAERVLQGVRRASSDLGTAMAVEDGVGVIVP